MGAVNASFVVLLVGKGGTTVIKDKIHSTDFQSPTTRRRALPARSAPRRPATVVPQQPTPAIENRIRLVNGFVFPLVVAGANDRVSRMTLPVGSAVSGAGHADLSVVTVTKTDVEQHMPVALPHDLAGRHPFLFPSVFRDGPEDRVVLVLRPFQSILAGGVADGIRLILLAPGVPQAEAFLLGVVKDVRAHDGHLLPRLVSGENGLVAPPLPGLPVLAGGKPDPRLAPCLSRIPHLVAVAVLEDDRAVDIVLPIGLTVGAEDDDGLAPPDAILAFDQGNAFLGSPREPQAVGVALLQNGDVEAGSQIAAQNRVLRVFDPSGRRLRGRCVRFVGPDTGQ